MHLGNPIPAALLCAALMGSASAASAVDIAGEDFTGQDGKGAVGPDPTIDLAGVPWSIDVSSADLTASSDWLQVQAEALEGRDLDGAALWLSPAYDISGYVNVALGITVSEAGDHEAADYVDVEYRVDGGAWVLIADWNGLGSADHSFIGDVPDDGDWGSERVIQSIGTGSTLELRVTMQNNAGSEYLRIDDIVISGDPSDGADTTPPAILASAPADTATGVPTDLAAIVVDFNEPLDTTASTAGNVTVQCPAGTGSRVAAAGFDDADTLTVGLDGSLPEGTLCTLTVPAGDIKDLAGNATTTDLGIAFETYAAPTLPFAETFDDCGLAGWTIYSIDADTANTWTCGGGYVEANAFGAAAAGNDWLITPPLDLSGATDPALSFKSYTGFTDADYPQLAVYYATDYSGGDPAGATWNALGGIDYAPENDFSWADSGSVDLSALDDVTVHIAFVYTSSGTGAGTSTRWRIDDVQVQEATPPVASSCGADGATPIHAVQGAGSVSPLEGQTVSIEGVVVGDFQATDGTGLRGFFVQEEDADADTDPATSEGIYVYDNGFGVDVMVGDIVRVSGTVVEFPSEDKPDALTEIGSVTDVQICTDLTGTATAARLELPLPNDQATDLEPLEGMAVDIVEAADADAADDALTLVEYFNLDRFGQIRVAAGGRPLQYTLDNAPDIAGYTAHLLEMEQRTLLIDDGRSGQNLDPIFFGRGGMPLDVTLDPPNLLRGGDTVDVIHGVMHFDFGDYRVQPVSSPNFVAANPRPTAPPAVAGALRVASFNVLNYFQQLDDGTAKCGPPENLQECRGADEGPVDSLGRNERDRQEAKLIPALLALDAHIYGLMELENDFGSGTTTSAERLAQLMDAANGTTAPQTSCTDYEAIAPETYVGTDVIAVGFVYCAAGVEPAPGTTVEVLDDSDLPALGLGGLAPLFDGNSTNRASLAASFRELASGAVLTVAVNHFKSKGGPRDPAVLDCDATPEDPDCDQGDGAGFWNQRRTDAATALASWLATDPTGAGDADYLILGDLNAYAAEDPIATLEAAGWENLIATRGDAASYSFLFDAQLGYLDYVMANAPLAAQVAGIAEWHINADEPDALDYDISFNPEQWLAEDEFRTSDHDPVIVGLNLTPPASPGDLNGDGQVDGADFSLFRQALGSRAGDPRWNPAADYDNDGVVSYRDYVIWYGYL